MEIEEETTRGNPTEESDQQIQPDEIKQETGPNICQHFLMGRCHFGDRCRLSHSVLDVPQTTNSEKDDTAVTEKQSKSRKNGKKCHADIQHEKIEKKGSKKKPRMRTADEVISRIIWDASVHPDDFIVGHLDRFLGVLERPFSDFSWDTQVCDCDFSEELALPRHRIQYFSYKGQRVWDRDSRTDRVFGSTGQTILPPFCGENQQQGERQYYFGPCLETLLQYFVNSLEWSDVEFRTLVFSDISGHLKKCSQLLLEYASVAVYTACIGNF